MMNDDMELLREYAAGQSEAAFETLVTRHAGLVYSAALRHTQDTHLAGEITQTVFIILARKAGSLSPRTILPGWLYRTTRHVLSAARKMQRRRERREQEAHMQAMLQESPKDPTWEALSPLLDEAMTHLPEKDQDAIVLRYFQNRNLSQVGAALGMNEYAAQKRVSRAVEKLRKFFTKRGVSSTAASITGAISINSVQAAPVALTKTMVTAAIAKGALASPSTLTLIKESLKLMAYKKTSLAIAGICAAVLLGVTISVPPVRTAMLNLPGKITGKLPAPPGKAALLHQMQAMKMSVWPALMKFSDVHKGEFPKNMDELRPFLPPGLRTMDDDHWRITAGDKGAKPKTPEELTFCEQINQPTGQPRIILYADGHVEYRK